MRICADGLLDWLIQSEGSSPNVGTLAPVANSFDHGLPGFFRMEPNHSICGSKAASQSGAEIEFLPGR